MLILSLKLLVVVETEFEGTSESSSVKLTVISHGYERAPLPC